MAEGGDGRRTPRRSRSPRRAGADGNQGRRRRRSRQPRRTNPAESPAPRAQGPAVPPATAKPARRDARWGESPQPGSPTIDFPAPPLSLAPDLPRDPAADDPDPATAHLDCDQAEPSAQAVANVAGIRFARTGRVYPYDAGDATYAVGDEVIVEGERAPRLGTVAVAPARRPHKGRLRRVLRHPNAGDKSAASRAEATGRDMLAAAKAEVRQRGLPIKLFRAEAGHRQSKVVIYFSSEERIDIRTLCRELSAALKTRVELRQTGVRDEAKMVGGIGSCGQELCCSTWLPQFVPVSIKMAKDQGLVLNPTKVAGQCGRLKCCLVYEQSTYVELKKGMPKLGKRVITEDGEGRVVELDVLRRRVRVQMGPGEHKTYAAEEVKPMFPSKRS